MGNTNSALASSQDGGDILSSFDSILQRVMRERSIFPHQVPDSLSRQTVRGHGKATCPHCKRRWTSYQASGIVDLQKQRVVKIWKQKCDTCKTEVDMKFTADKFEESVNNMLSRYERKRRGEPPSDDFEKFGGPQHIRELCEGCGYGTGDCRKYRVTDGTPKRMDTGTRSSGDSGECSSDSSIGALGLGVAVGAGLLAGALVWAFSGDKDKPKPKK